MDLITTYLMCILHKMETAFLKQQAPIWLSGFTGNQIFPELSPGRSQRFARLASCFELRSFKGQDLVASK